jgi:hypothetical protein
MTEPVRLEPFTPADMLTVARADDGTVLPARATTSDEQRAEAIAHVRATRARTRESTGVVEVRWSRGEPTLLTVAGHVEHLPTPRGTQRVFAVDAVTEHTLGGVPILRDEAVRLRTLRAELADMAARDAGPA